MRSTRDAAFMGIMRKALIARVKVLYPNVKISDTYGYITKYLREKNSLIKTHCTDALCIAKHPNALRIEKQYTIIPVRRHNRQIHKATVNKGGVRKRNQAAYTVKGFRLYDKVLFKDQEGFIFGRRTSGSFDIRRLDGTRLSAGAGYKKLTLLERTKPLLIA